MTQPMYRPSPEAPTAYPYLADSLRHLAHQICDCWSAAVRVALPSADDAAFAALRAEVPRMLSELADTVGGSRAGNADPPESLAPRVEDAPQELRIDETTIALGLLRRTVFEQLPRQMRRDLSGNEVVAVNEYLDFMVNQAVVAHSERQAARVRAANEGQKKYLSFLSHDLRGGLNGIFLMVEVLRRELAGRAELAQTLEDLDIMRRSIIETVANMDRFLYAERFRTGSVRVMPTNFSLRTLLAEIGSRFTYAAKDQGIELKVELTERADIVTDRELLALALHSLVANAVKNTTQGAVVLSGRPREEGSGWIVEICDSGRGIEPAQLEKMRDCFLNPKPGQPSPGLGLSLASQACRLIGATLGAESTLGTGSRFWIEVAVTQTPHPQSGAGSSR